MDKTITYVVAIVAVVSLIVGTYGFVTFQGQIADLENSNATLENTISSLQGTLNTIEGQIEEYQEMIERQQAQISEYQTVTLVDAVGNVVTLTEPPERIVSLSPSNTEILFAVGAGDTVVGVTKYGNYPYNFTAWAEAGNITIIGGYSDPSTETIVSLEPDLILATSQSLDAAETLRNLGLNVLVIEAHTLEETFQDILMVGRATGNHTEAGEIVSELRERIDTVVNQVAEAATTPKVYHEVWDDPLMSAGPGTFIDDLITLACGKNIFYNATASWPMISSEAVIQNNPDVMVFPDMYMGVENFYETIEAVANRPGWDAITAVQNDDIYEVNADIISRPGPRLVDALEILAQMIHPEIFGEP